MLVIEKRDRGYCSARAPDTEYAGVVNTPTLSQTEPPSTRTRKWRVTPAIWG
jgi:hypothetical protein